MEAREVTPESPASGEVKREGFTLDTSGEVALGPCARCAGNGEIITDRERYLSPHPGDAGDAGTADCPDCGGRGELPAYVWSDLDAFTQGYVEALFESGGGRIGPVFQWVCGFSDLAPETLARIIADCAAVADFAEFFADNPGASFWLNRQSAWPAWSDRRPRLVDRFPPLTAYLGDDGKVYLREVC